MNRRELLAWLCALPFVRHFVAGAPELPKPTEYHWSDCYANFDGPCDCDGRALPRADTPGQDELAARITETRRRVDRQTVDFLFDNPPAGEA